MKVRRPNDEEEFRKLETMEAAEAARTQLLQRQPFVGALIMRLELVPVCDSRLDTACTDGQRVFLDSHFFLDQLDDEGRIFILAHEVWHVALMHFERRQWREKELWNVATDLEIQFTMALDEPPLTDPYPMKYRPGWKGMSAEELYEALREEGPVSGPLRAIDDCLGSNNDVPVPPAEGDGDGESQGDGGQSAATGAKSEFIVDKDFAPNIKAGHAEKVREWVVLAGEEVKRQRGSLPLGASSVLDDIVQPKIPWQRMLAQFVTQCYGGERRWLPPSRRHVYQELYLPSMRDEKLRAVVAVDTSGSTMHDLPVFFGELTSLLESFGKYELTVIQCDAKIHLVETFDAEHPWDHTKPWRVKGYGGTDFRPVFEYIDKHSELEMDRSLLIFFTDGDGYYPEQSPGYPVLWVLSPGSKVTVPWGQVTTLE